MIAVNEVFDTIQGEGVHTGRPATFVRLARCNLACMKCDSEFNNPVMEMTVAEIIKRLNTKIPIVVITGGEPTLQNLDALLIELVERGYQAHLQTNGTQKIHEFFTWVCVSPKLKYMEPLYESVIRADEIKMPITCAEDIEEAEAFRAKFAGAKAEWYLHPWNDNFEQIRHGKNLSPGARSLEGFNSDNNRLCVEHAVKTGRWRVSVQVHKILGVR